MNVKELSPPEGIVPVNICGVWPEHIVCAELMLLFVITGRTVTLIDKLVSDEHIAELTILLKYIVFINDEGEYEMRLLVPAAADQLMLSELCSHK
jgi:hypothetical protein